jgi:von Willebrand factor A domain-containing protein 5
LLYKVTIIQTYKNIEKDTIEAQYKFPIHEAAAVCEFEAEIDGQRKVKGIVKEAKEAAKEYTEAIQVNYFFKKIYFCICKVENVNLIFLFI